jgi:Na+/H+ antiporter NhaD/arsenite permease-like protein
MVTLAYYLLAHPSGAASALNFARAGHVLAEALLSEYVPFFLLLLALYTISGGIRLEGDLRAHPAVNTGFLAVGAVLASLVGTTGAAMLLIRPLLDTNSQRRRVSHTVVFFIFIVCNCGGCLLPTGDPPLFLGYLLGVDFFWTLRLWPEWLLVNGALLAVYYGYDHWWCYRRERPADIARDEAHVRPLRLRGLWPNALLLVSVIAAVALLDPRGPLPGTDWHPWIYLREMGLLVLVSLSLLLGDAEVRQANRFSFAPIVEVAVLFLGIFICMQPAIEILSVKGPSLGLTSPTQLFWATGGLSSVLDNAPTYVVFFETAKTLGGAPTVAGVPEPLLRAVSLGAVFMGANTYIGNGPNFMVKAIAEQSGVRMPGFFGYMTYSLLILVPLFAATNWIFLR